MPPFPKPSFPFAYQAAGCHADEHRPRPIWCRLCDDQVPETVLKIQRTSTVRVLAPLPLSASESLLEMNCDATHEVVGANALCKFPGGGCETCRLKVLG